MASLESMFTSISVCAKPGVMIKGEATAISSPIHKMFATIFLTLVKSNPFYSPSESDVYILGSLL